MYKTSLFKKGRTDVGVFCVSDRASKAKSYCRSLAGIASSKSAPGHRCLFVVSVVCWQVEVSATCRSLVQRSPTDCGVSTEYNQVQLYPSTPAVG